MTFTKKIRSHLRKKKTMLIITKRVKKKPVIKLDNLFTSAEYEINNVAEKAQARRLIEHNGPAFGGLEHVTGEFDTHKARQRAQRVHNAEYGPCVFRRQILRVHHDARIVETAAEHCT